MSPSRPASALVGLAVCAAVIWHVLSILTPAWVQVSNTPNGRDFASYYYAARVGTEGGDPYDRRALNAAARVDGIRAGVHPFFYPPPFVAGTAWLAWFDLHSAYKLWFWLDELSAVLAMLALWIWWRELDPLAPAAIAVLLALMTAVPNNHAMGQANLGVLALLLLGLLAEDRKRPVIGGVFVGMACMAKMSPALFVAWWLLRRRWVAASTACLTAVVLSVASLSVVGWADQLRFYTEILPKFASGDYNGLSIPIDLFGNHSIPNLFHQLWPSQGRALSSTAALGSRVFSLGMVTGLGLLYGIRPPIEDRWTVAGQAASVAVAMLLIPVYTYEHHLVWALPAAVLAVLAASSGRLPWPLVIVAGISVSVLAFDLQGLKAASNEASSVPVALLFQEAKTLALMGLLLCTAWVGRGLQSGSVGTDSLEPAHEAHPTGGIRTPLPAPGRA